MRPRRRPEVTSVFSKPDSRFGVPPKARCETWQANIEFASLEDIKFLILIKTTANSRAANDNGSGGTLIGVVWKWPPPPPPTPSAASSEAVVCDL